MPGMSAPDASQSSPRHTRVAMAFHGVIALIVVANLAGGLGMAALFASHDPMLVALGQTVVALHKAMGLIVIGLSLVQIGWPIRHPPPPLPPYMTAMETILARGVHWLFHMLLLALPITGWAMMSTSQTVVPIDMFGWFGVPPLPLPRALADFFQRSHHRLGWLMLATLGLHVLAVAKHLIFDRENLLPRIMPWRDK